MIGQGWLYGAAFAAGLLVAGVGQEWRWSDKYETYQATVAKDATDRANAVLMALEAAGAKVKAGEDAISQQREENAKATELQAAENDRLNRCLKSGACGLHVAAKCPSVPDVAPGNNTSRNTDGAPKLTAAAGSSYMEFRRRYTEQLNTLKTCKVFGETQKPSL